MWWCWCSPPHIAKNWLHRDERQCQPRGPKEVDAAGARSTQRALMYRNAANFCSVSAVLTATLFLTTILSSQQCSASVNVIYGLIVLIMPILTEQLTNKPQQKIVLPVTLEGPDPCNVKCMDALRSCLWQSAPSFERQSLLFPKMGSIMKVED